jgi:stress-induced morphogen
LAAPVHGSIPCLSNPAGQQAERDEEDHVMPMLSSEIERLIKQGIPDAKVEITDLAGDNNHYAAVVVSSEFASKSKLQQHQLVYKALSDVMGDALHALQLQTFAPK